MNPCPNCGGTNVQEEQLWGIRFYPYTNSFGYCYKCSDCNFRSKPKGTKSAAKTQWNRGNGKVFITANKKKKSKLSRLIERVLR